MMYSCGNCRFFAGVPEHIHGRCRRVPPVYTCPEYGWEQPPVMKDEWCGEHRPVTEPAHA